MNSQYLRFGVPIAFVLTFLIILPHLLSSITQQHDAKVAPKHTLDSVFLPNSQSIILQEKANQLVARLKNLKNGSACTGSNGQVCEKLKSHYNEQMRQVGINFQNKASQRLIYQTKWNTTCQQWMNESQRYLAITTDLAIELKANSIKIQKMDFQISQLEIQKKRRSTCPKNQSCPICPQGETVQCPDEVPCVQCEEEECPHCEECQECPHCYHHDYDQLIHQFDILTHKFDQCQQEIAGHQDNQKEPEVCSDIHDQINQNLIDGLNSLSDTLQKVSIVSTNLKQIITKAQQQVSSSKSVQDSLSILPLILNGLTKELQDFDAKSKSGSEKECKNCGDSYGKILSECMDSFKKTIDKLANCQTAISPFLASNKQ